MNIEQLKQLVDKGESDRLEFKKSTTQMKPAFETLCGFLNGGGGVILFGVTDNGQIVGQHVGDKTKQELARELSKIEPKPSPEIQYIDIGQDKQVIVIEALAGAHLPYVYDGRPFEKNQSTTERMSQHGYERLLIQRNQLNHSWEEFPAEEYTLDDLDHDEIRHTIKEGVEKNRIGIEVFNYSIEQILTNLKLMKQGQLTNAAVVLYAKDPEKIFSRCAIKMARFRGIDKIGGFIDNQWNTGNAFQLISIAHQFASRHLPIAGFFEPDNWQRIDQPAVPALALREALINSICHRDYTVRSATNSLAIFDDRMELWNVGTLPSELKIENLKQPHNSFQRNEIIAHVFYKRGWIEKWGTGTIRMMDYCKKNGTPDPEFEEYSGGFAVTFPFKEAMNSVVKQYKEPHSVEFTLTQRQKDIIQALQEKIELTTVQISEHLENSPPIRTLRYDLAILKNAGIIDTRRNVQSAVWFLHKK